MTTTTAIDPRQPTSISTKRDRDSLEASLHACTRCPYAHMGNGPVMPIGPTPNDIMVIGEAPTRLDDRAKAIAQDGEPSLLLNRLLAKSGLDPTRLFFTNTVSCWPGFRDAKPGLKNVRACTDNLRHQIRVCNPRLVLTLGATALDAIRDRKLTVSQNHGAPFLSQAGPLRDRWVYPTWHPAALRRNAGAVTDLHVDIAQFVTFYRAMTEAGWPEEGLKPWVR